MTAYRATASLQAVPLENGAVLLKSDLASCRVDGESAALVADRVLPALLDWRTLDAIMEQLPGYGRDDVEQLLRSLVDARLIVSRTTLPQAPLASVAGRVLADLGIDEVAVGDRLATLHVGVIGTTAHAEAICGALASAGVGRIARFAQAAPDAGEDDSPDLRETVTNGSAAMPLSKQAIAAAAGQLDLMIAAVDQSFLAARHWVNQASLESGCPAIFLDIGVTEAVVGPTLLPGETGCYMCFRMRHIATEDNFAEAMGHERHLDGLRAVSAERASFPGLAEIAIGALLGESFRLLFGPLMPALPNAVLHIDALSFRFDRHEVLRQPECPHCRTIDTAVRSHG